MGDKCDESLQNMYLWESLGHVARQFLQNKEVSDQIRLICQVLSMFLQKNLVARTAGSPELDASSEQDKQLERLICQN